MSRRPRRDDLIRPEGIPGDAIVRVFRVPPEWAGRRLDVFVQAHLRNTSRTRAQDIIRKTAYSPDARRLKPNDRVKAEERVVLWRQPFEEQDRPTTIVVLHEDPDLLVVDKPPLMAVHPTARHHHNTVIKLLQAQRPDEELALIHRIDRETSGVLLVARSKASERAFKRLLEDRSHESKLSDRIANKRVRKVYLAITRGVPAAGSIDLPLEQDPDNPLRVKMRVADLHDPSTHTRTLHARTDVEPLEERAGYGLIRCELFTGRQHQIRVHLAALGCPLVGDKLYGDDDRLLARAADGELTDADRLALELPRHALHAHRYELDHALSGEPLELTSPLPPDLQEFWDSRDD